MRKKCHLILNKCRVEKVTEIKIAMLNIIWCIFSLGWLKSDLMLECVWFVVIHDVGEKQRWTLNNKSPHNFVHTDNDNRKKCLNRSRTHISLKRLVVFMTVIVVIVVTEFKYFLITDSHFHFCTDYSSFWTRKILFNEIVINCLLETAFSGLLFVHHYGQGH